MPISEADWRTTTRAVAPMYQRVCSRATPRTLQLVGCGLCRAVGWAADGTEPGEVLAATVGMVERYADGLATDAEFLARQEAAYLFPADWEYNPADIAERALLNYRVRAAVGQIVNHIRDVVRDTDRLAAACDVLREVAGNPFRPWQSIPAAMGGGVVQPDGATVRVSDAARLVAEGIAADQAFDRLPVLADALEDGGVTDAELLAHCRRPGGHLRGCWAVDVVTGRT